MTKLTKITVTSARVLDDAEKARVEEVFGKKFPAGIDTEYLVDDSLIGGLMIFDGKTVYDGSVKTKLQKIREKLSDGRK